MSTAPLHQSVLLNCHHVSWSIAEQEIIKDISFAIHAQQFVGLLGPNGAGKSTLLRCLYRYLKPTDGKVSFENDDIWGLSAASYAQQVAVVLQETPHLFNLSVHDVVALGLVPHSSIFSRYSQTDEAKIFNALEQVGLAKKQFQSFDSLSGGEKQRAMIARAVVQSPKLLIMDEPTSHLDIKYQIEIMELAKSLDITVLASFHDLNLASALCDRLLVLKAGRLVASGTPHEVVTESLLSDVFNVCAQVAPHPQHGAPNVTYFYGYQQGNHDG